MWIWEICLLKICFCLNRLFLKRQAHVSNMLKENWEPGYFSLHNDYATGWTNEEVGFDSQEGKESFLSSITSRPALRTIHLPVHWIPGAVSSKL
jgi:hypothetical protein